MFARDKFRELLLYVARKEEDDASFGAIKLNKILFFADFAAYRRFGKSITGARYQALPYGPAPKELLPIREEMEREGELCEVERDYFGRTQRKIIATREPKIGALFSADEMVLVDAVIEELRDLDASEVSRLSHEFDGWKHALPGEEIPYETALLNRGTPTARDLEEGRRLNREFGWTAASPR